MKPIELNKIPVTYLWEVAVWSMHGYHIKIHGNRAYMVRTVH